MAGAGAGGVVAEGEEPERESAAEQQQIAGRGPLGQADDRTRSSECLDEVVNGNEREQQHSDGSECKRDPVLNEPCTATHQDRKIPSDQRDRHEQGNRECNAHTLEPARNRAVDIEHRPGGGPDKGEGPEPQRRER